MIMVCIGMSNLTPNEIAGTGLQIRVADLDNNGWLDLVVSGKTGLHILKTKESNDLFTNLFPSPLIFLPRFPIHKFAVRAVGQHRQLGY